MISIATDDREIVLIYNSDIKNHREIFAYAQSADVKVNALDIQKEKITGTLWTEIADLLGKEVKDLVHTDYGAFVQKHGENITLDNDGAIKILQNEPEMFVFPIAIRGKHAIEPHLYGDVTQLFSTDTGKVDIP
jgi:arsenate reductase-like glutaredoxin family protein